MDCKLNNFNGRIVNRTIMEKRMKTVRKVLFRGSESEIIEKKSRFIANIEVVESEIQANEFINSIKKKYWEARHNCFAYVVDKDLMRFSDDGEPSGTAGKPMLDVLIGNNIERICVVVTRYFGGVLLGTGGLVRAYQKAVLEALEKCVILEADKGEVIKIVSDYNSAGKIRHFMENNDVYLNNIKYEVKVEIEAIINIEDKDNFIEKITETTGGQAQIVSLGEVLYSVYESNLILF